MTATGTRAVAVLPRAIRDGDTVTIENVRNFDYRSLEDFTPRYECARYHLANLTGVDVDFLQLGFGHHEPPVLVFDFGADGRVCISIEVRYRQWPDLLDPAQSLPTFMRSSFWSPTSATSILRRTKYGPGQDAHMYRLVTTPDDAAGGVSRLGRCDQRLVQTPLWYHGLCMNCTTTFYRLPSASFAGTGVFSPMPISTKPSTRPVGWIETCRSRNSAAPPYLNDIANSAPEEGFGDHIRRELERRRHDR